MLTTLTQTRQGKIAYSIFRETLKCWYEHTRYILLLRPDSETGILDRFLYLIGDIPIYGVCHFSQGKCSDLHDPAHFAFGLIDSFENIFTFSQHPSVVLSTKAAKLIYLESAYMIGSLVIDVSPKPEQIARTLSRPHSSASAGHVLFVLPLACSSSVPTLAAWERLALEPVLYQLVIPHQIRRNLSYLTRHLQLDIFLAVFFLVDYGTPDLVQLRSLGKWGV